MKLAISRCLLGDAVRYDGGHQRHQGVMNLLKNRHIQVIPFCPELELGLGVPRPPIHLTGDRRSPRLQVINSGEDITEAMRAVVDQLYQEDLDGMVLKSRSPSCGMSKVKVFHRDHYIRHGRGLFAATLMERYRYMPVCQETNLLHGSGRRRFLLKLEMYHKWKAVVDSQANTFLRRFYQDYREFLPKRALTYFRPAVKYATRRQRPRVATELLLVLYAILDQT